MEFGHFHVDESRNLFPVKSFNHVGASTVEFGFFAYFLDDFFHTRRVSHSVLVFLEFRSLRDVAATLGKNGLVGLVSLQFFLFLGIRTFVIRIYMQFLYKV